MMVEDSIFAEKMEVKVHKSDKNCKKNDGKSVLHYLMHTDKIQLAK